MQLTERDRRRSRTEIAGRPAAAWRSRPLPMPRAVRQGAGSGRTARPRNEVRRATAT